MKKFKKYQKPNKNNSKYNNTLKRKNKNKSKKFQKKNKKFKNKKYKKNKSNNKFPKMTMTKAIFRKLMKIQTTMMKAKMKMKKKS